MDDFEAFRKKRKAQKEALEKAEEANARAAANGKKLDWVEGMGPSGPTNPKVKGFILGRFQRKRIDPKELERPEGYEATRAKSVTPHIDDEVAKRRAQLERAEAELRAAEEKRLLAEIAKRRKEEGFKKIKGMKRF